MNLHMEQAAPATLKNYILYSAALQSGAAAMICLSRSNIILQDSFPRPGDPPRRPESHGADPEKQEVIVKRGAIEVPDFKKILETVRVFDYIVL